MDDDVFLLNNIIEIKRSTPVDLVTKLQAEDYINANRTSAFEIKTTFFSFDQQQFTIYHNKFLNEVVIAANNITSYELLKAGNVVFIKKLDQAALLVKETMIHTAVDPKSIEHFATLLKNELQEGIDRAVAKYLGKIT